MNNSFYHLKSIFVIFLNFLPEAAFKKGDLHPAKIQEDAPFAV
jgi:hypothetical protein